MCWQRKCLPAAVNINTNRFFSASSINKTIKLLFKAAALLFKHFIFL
jgi:hypothetical protein